MHPKHVSNQSALFAVVCQCMHRCLTKGSFWIQIFEAQGYSKVCQHRIKSQTRSQDEAESSLVNFSYLASHGCGVQSRFIWHVGILVALRRQTAVLALVLLSPVYAFNCMMPEWFCLIQPSKGTVLFRDLLLCCVCSCLRRGSEGNVKKTIDWASRRAQAPIHWRSEEVQTFKLENNNIVMKIYLKPGTMFVC